MPANIPEVVESPVAASDEDGCSASEIHRTTALAIWNRFVSEHGSFSDEHSTL